MEITQTSTKRLLYKTRQATLGQTLRELRQERHLLQADIASALDIAQPDVSKMEAGERSIKFVEVDLYAYALGMTVGEFVKCLLEAMLSASSAKKADGQDQ